MAEGDRSLAVFVDFENLALGFQGRRDRFDIGRVLERLVEKGKIVVKKAYADWNRFAPYTHAMHEAAIELIEIPRRGQTGKNSADIRLCVDAMDLAYSKEHINTFVIVSGDSDFSPLVSKLKELGKHVIGLGMSESTSDLLRDNCDEFIYYEDLGQEPALEKSIDAHIPDAKRKAFALLMDALHALRRENKDVLWSSMIKDTIKRKKPSFNETYHGYRTFSEMLEDAQREGLLELDTDKRSRTYVVTRFGNEIHAEPGAVTPAVHVTEPTSPGITVSPTLFGPPVDAGAGQPVVVGEGQPGVPGTPPRKKSRRRRRRGSGQGQPQAPGNGSNGQHGPMVAYGTPPAAPAAGAEARAPVPEPLPVVVDAAPPSEPVEPEPEEDDTGFGAGVFESEPKPAPPPPAAAEEEAPAKPARRRTTSGTRTRKTTSPRTKKAAASSEDAAAPPAEGEE